MLQYTKDPLAHTGRVIGLKSIMPTGEIVGSVVNQLRP